MIKQSTQVTQQLQFLQKHSAAYWNGHNLGHLFDAGQCSSDMTLHSILASAVVMIGQQNSWFPASTYRAEVGESGPKHL